MTTWPGEPLQQPVGGVFPREVANIEHRAEPLVDNLQGGLKASATEIQLQFNILRRVLGSKMDRGDEKARPAMDIYQGIVLCVLSSL
jgi:hypothetical protein